MYFFKHYVQASVVRALQNTPGGLSKDLHLAFFALLERHFNIYFIKVNSTNEEHILEFHNIWKHLLRTVPDRTAKLSGLDELVWEFGNYWRTYHTNYTFNDTDIMNIAELCEFLRDLGR